MAKRKKQEGERGEYGRGSIYPAADGAFIVAVRPCKGAKPVRRRAPNREAAEALQSELVRLRDKGVDIERGSQSVEDFTDYWYNEVYLQRGRAERSNKHTLDMLELHILPIIGKRELLAVSHAELQQLLNDLRRRPKPKRPLSAQTVNHVASVLKQIFGKAFAMAYIERDPTYDLEIPDVVRPAKPALTIAQVRSLLAVVEGHPYEVPFHLMAFLGLRLGESLAVRRSDFNADFTEVYIQQAADYHTHAMGNPKRGSKRRLPVAPRLAALCRAQWEKVKQAGDDPTPNFQNGGLLCPSEVGTAIQSSNFEKAWHGYTKPNCMKKGQRYTRYYAGFRQKAGLPDGTILHDLRSFLATELEDLEIGTPTIGHILGHGAKNVTEGYIRRAMPSMRRALVKLEAAVWAEPGAQEKTG